MRFDAAHLGTIRFAYHFRSADNSGIQIAAVAMGTLRRALSIDIHILGTALAMINSLRQSRRNKRKIFAHLLAVTLLLLIAKLCVFCIDLLIPSRYQFSRYEQ
jgi:hypothetical protein